MPSSTACSTAGRPRVNPIRLRHVLAAFSLIFFVAITLPWLPQFIGRSRRIAQQSAMPVRETLTRTIARSDGTAEFFKVDNRNGTAAVEIEAHTSMGGARASLPDRRTNEAAVLYESLEDAGISSLADSADHCQSDDSNSRRLQRQRAAAWYCVRVSVRYQSGSVVHERTVVFDDRAVARRARREIPLKLSDTSSAADALTTIRIESAKSQPGAYAKIMAAFDAFGGPETAAALERLQRAAASKK